MKESNFTVQGARATGMLIIFTVTIFASAFLVFLIQPMFARMALPLLGGAPAVWNTALAFYQAALLAGYAYAHASTARLQVRFQSALHIVLMLLPLLMLPIGLPLGWKPPADADPTMWLLALMTVAIGLPFLVVSAGSPILQRWFASCRHMHSSDPYFLYAASNLGSLAALLGYPLLIEPHFHLQQQGRLWSFGYCVLVILMATCAILVWRLQRKDNGQSYVLCANCRDFAAIYTESRIEPESHRGNPASRRPGLSSRLRWIALAFVPSSLMLSVTTYLTTDIAAMPLLWVIPMSLYLITFILVFSRIPLYPQKWLVPAMPVVLLAVTVTLASRRTDPIIVVMPLHLIAFFVIAMVCHGELASRRPPAEELTRFYLYMSIGGVLGGIFNGLMAPVIFNSIAEYPIVLALACLVLPWPTIKTRRANLLDLLLPLLLGLVTLILLLRVQSVNPHISVLSASFVFGLPAFVSISFSRRPMRLALSVASIFVVSTFYVGSQGNILYLERSFFGVTKVSRDPSGEFIQILHGRTLHGKQWIPPTLQHEPLAYYHRSGPLGQLFEALNNSGRFKRVAVMGLGSGAITCYAEPGQHWTYYEIDPVVEHLARDSRFFTYLRDSRGDIEVELGDGRLLLADAADGAFDLFIMDAYNSDALPVHLLTRQALELYTRKLAPRGILAFHISNRYLDLEPVLANLARDAGLYCVIQHDKVVNIPGGSMGAKDSSKYALMVREQDNLGPLYADHRWMPARHRDAVGVWTDSYSSILPILKWRPVD